MNIIIGNALSWSHFPSEWLQTCTTHYSIYKEKMNDQIISFDDITERADQGMCWPLNVITYDICSLNVGSKALLSRKTFLFLTIGQTIQSKFVQESCIFKCIRTLINANECFFITGSYFISITHLHGPSMSQFTIKNVVTFYMFRT